MAVPTKIISTPQASLAIALHCIRHSTEAVHGVLLGYVTTTGTGSNGGVEELTITDAVPVTHGAPTLPIVEVALGLLPHCMKHNTKANSNSKATIQIVGWYTAPMLVNDTKPDPLALRMIANLAQGSNSAAVITDPILMVVQNESLATFVKGVDVKSPAKAFLKAYTKDGTNQWLKPIDDTIVTANARDDIVVAIEKAKDQGIMISDLLDFFDECSTPPSLSTSSTVYWYPNDKIVALL
jgi:Uncharacterised protein family (UPF0172)